MDKHIDEVNLVKLRSITNEIELGIIKEILEDNKIPYIVKDYGPGAHMRIISGGSIFGTDVMVSEEDILKASDLLESINIEE